MLNLVPVPFSPIDLSALLCSRRKGNIIRRTCKGAGLWLSLYMNTQTQPVSNLILIKWKRFTQEQSRRVLIQTTSKMIFASISNICLYSELLSESIASVIHPIIGILLYINENVLVLKQQGVLKKIKGNIMTFFLVWTRNKAVGWNESNSHCWE